ncbi:hypothetical protein GZH47_06425 [Paenibacillus rhizovicinus]|uniref:Uncharacterized protein n=1 Tax=Paenibacillus rhizovicinus TaxID=2704463 RepID=A0A6C0NXT3_9BACL|nr:hypothetical protein [Paenibacillus rhizovicinus]QHW30523.1 hypothetical protein GZH47_06425 [Paenibacillus rhizovicinus]
MLNTIADRSLIDESAGYRRDTLPGLIEWLRFKNSVVGSSFALLQQDTITRIECFRFDREWTEKLHPGRGNDYCCGLLAITAHTGAVGAAEFAIPCKQLSGDLVMWTAPLQRMKGRTLPEGLDYVQQKQAAWGALRSELVKSALLNANRHVERAAASHEERQYRWDPSCLHRYTQSYVSF